MKNTIYFKKLKSFCNETDRESNFTNRNNFKSTTKSTMFIQEFGKCKSLMTKIITMQLNEGLVGCLIVYLND